jgi:hypothetical protein
LSKEFKVGFESAQEVSEFCAKVKKYVSGDVDAKSGRYVVNAKSILGLLSISIDEMLISMDVYTTEEIDTLERICEEYKVEG